MLTPEQTNALIADGAQQVLLKCGNTLMESTTFLECLVYANTIINDAMHNGDHNDIMIQSALRDKLTQQAAGILFLALQTYGHAMYTDRELKRNLHPTQAPRKALLLEHQFMANEAENAFNACLDASRTGQPHDQEAWLRLRGAIQKLGAKV